MIACVAVIGVVRAQSPRIGVEAAIVGGVTATAVAVYAGSPECGEFSTGSHLGGAAGLRLWLPTLFGKDIGFALRAGYSTSSTTASADPSEPLLIYEAETDEVVEIPRSYELELAERRVEGSLLVTLALAPRLSIAAGPWLGVRTSSELRQFERITPSSVAGEPTYSFDSGRTERPLDRPTPLAPSRFVGGIALAASYQLALGNRFLLEPTLTIDATPFSSMSGGPWRELRASFAIALSYDLGADSVTTAVVVDIAAPTTPTPTTTQAKLAVPSRIDASIELGAVGRSGDPATAAGVTVYETLERVRVGLDPRVPFEAGSAQLPIIYRMDDRGLFDPDSLALADARSLEDRALDVIGWRLGRRIDARVVLSPSTGTGEPSWLGFARAEAVRTYLESRWGVARSRIEIRPPSTRGRRSRSRAGGVEIAGEPRELTAAFVAERTTRAIDPPIVRLEPRFTSSAGVVSASVELAYDGRTIARYGAWPPSDDEAALSWQIPTAASGGGTLTAELRVMDSTGRDTISRASLPITLERRRRFVERATAAGSIRERIVATLFADGGLEGRNAGAIAKLARSLRPGARVTVDASPAVVDAIRRALAASSGERFVVRSGSVAIPSTDHGQTRTTVRIAVEQTRP